MGEASEVLAALPSAPRSTAHTRGAPQGALHPSTQEHSAAQP